MQKLAMVFAIALAIGAGVYAEVQRREAQRQAGLVTGPQLATQAYLLYERAPWLAHRSALLALEAYARAPTPETGAILRRIAESIPPLLVSIPHEKAVNAIAFSKDGRLLTGGADGFLRVTNLEDSSELFAIAHERPVNDIIVSPDGSRLATLEYNPRHVTLWNAVTGEPDSEIEHKRSFERLAFSPSGRLLVTTNYQYPAAVWSADTGDLLFETDAGIGIVNASFGRGDDLLVGAGRDSFIHVWDVATGEELFRRPHDASKVAISADGRLVASGDREGLVRLWSIEDGREFPSWKLTSGIKILRFMPENRLLAASDDAIHISAVDGTQQPAVIQATGIRQTRFSAAAGLIATLDEKRIVQIWDADTAQQLTLMVPEESVRDFAFDDSGRFLAASGRDGFVSVWDLSPMTALRHTGPVTGLAISPDGRRLVSSGRDGTTRIWDIAQSAQLEMFDHGDRVNSVAFSPDGAWFAAGDSGGMARVWATDDLAEQMRLAHIGEFVMFDVISLAASPDSSYLASGGSDGRARLWVLEYGLPREALNNGVTVLSVNFSPDGKKLATGDRSKARLWDVDSLALLAEYPHKCAVNDIEFDPRGNRLATACSDGLIRLWDISSGQAVREMLHEDAVEAIAFSPDGSHISSTSRDRTARIWTVDTGEEVVRMILDDDGYAIAFSRDGRQLATGSRSGRIQLWPVVKSDVIADVCARLTRSLSDQEVERYLAGATPRRPCGK